MIRHRVLHLLIFTLFIGCESAKKKEDSKSESSPAPSWSASMQELSTVLSQITPILSDENSLKNKNKRKELLALTKQLSHQAHQIRMNPNAPSVDPALKNVSRSFDSEIKNTLALMEKEKWSQARNRMLGITNNCIACHTMSASTMNRPTLVINPDLSGLNEAQKGDFFASIRQFDKAINHYENALSDKPDKRVRTQEWGQTFQKLMAVTVRVNSSPSLTMELISRFLDSHSYPRELEPKAKIWRTHAKEWRNDKSQSRDEKLLTRKLLKKAEEFTDDDRHEYGLVLYLRASALMNRYFMLHSEKKDSEALYLAGQVAEGLSSRNFGSSAEDYYLACETAGASAWKTQCTERLAVLRGQHEN